MNAPLFQDTISMEQEEMDSSGFYLELKGKHGDTAWLSIDGNMTYKTVKREPHSSFFSGNDSGSKALVAIERNYQNHDWLTIHFIICLALLAWVQVFYRKRFVQVLKAFTGGHYLNQLEREGNLFRERIVIPLVIVYLVSFTSLLYLTITRIIDLSFFDLTEFKLFSLLMLAVLLMWFLKNVFITLIGNVFRNYLLLNNYLLINLVSNIVIGFVLFPVVVIAVYTNFTAMIFTGLIIWGVIFLIRVFRELLTALTYTKFSLFPRILYLCTFEFVPLLVLTKLVMSYLT